MSQTAIAAVATTTVIKQCTNRAGTAMNYTFVFSSGKILEKQGESRRPYPLIHIYPDAFARFRRCH